LFGRTNFDGNKDNRLRIDHAYAVQMSKDNSWISDGRTPEIYSEACSGTYFTRIDRDWHNGHKQLNDNPNGTDMILTQIGGNDAGFATIASACIYTPQGEKYGLSYPDHAGQCAKRIQRAYNYIHSQDKNQ
jgi:hypothetical protein